MDFFGRQDWARKRTRWLVTLFVLAVIALVLAVNLGCYLAVKIGAPMLLNDVDIRVGGFVSWMLSKAGLVVSLVTLLVIGLGSGINWLRISGGGKDVANLVGARRIAADSKDPDERRLINIVEEMSIASGTPVPALYVMDHETGINAFVAGLNQQDTVLVVTKGALQTLNRQELQGVIAHEYSHILNYDMRLNVHLLGVLAGILLIGQLGEFIIRHIRFSGRRSNDKDSGGGVLAIILLGVALLVIGYLGLFFGRLIKAGVSRQREFLADASAVQFTRDNSGIAGALAKIQSHSGQSLLMNAHAEDMSHMCFGESVKVQMSGMLSTHPPLPERIKALGFSPEVLVRQQLRRQQEQAEAEAKAASVTKPKAAAPGFNMPGAEVLASAAIMASIGTVQPEQLAQAEALLETIPLELHQLAHDRRQVAMLLIALMLHRQPIDKTLQPLLAKTLNDEQRQRLPALCDDVNQLQPEPRMALLNLCKLAVQELDKLQKQQLLQALLGIARQDQHISLAEFIQYTLVRQWALPKKHKGPTLNRFTQVQQALVTVLGTFVFCCGEPGRNPEKVEQFRQALSSFELAGEQALPERFEAVAFDEALDVLDRLSPLLKKPLLATLTELTLADNQVSVEERELLRAIAERLNCAMPLLPKQA